MIDAMAHLGAAAPLQALLAHYRPAADGDRDAWRPRPAALAGLRAADLVRLHGELLAFGWLEQDTGAAVCQYRLTAAGRRALRELGAGGEAAEG
jgi:hypothetical protein